MYRRILVIALSIFTLAGEAQGQLHSSQGASLLSSAARAEMAGARQASTHSLLRRTLYTAGGALVGAGLGYFTSHVVYSDWDKSSNSSFLQQRRLYSASGATVGALVGLFVGRGRGGGAIPVGALATREAEGVERISREEIVDLGAGTVYAVIQSLRPDWLIVRGSKSIFEQGQVLGDDRAAATVPGMPQIRTYIDQALLGGVDDLRRIPALDAQTIEFLSPSQATFRLGRGNPHGAIVVSISADGG